MCEKFRQFLAIGRWFSPGTPVSSTRRLTSSFHRLDMTLAVAEALNPNIKKGLYLHLNSEQTVKQWNNTQLDGIIQLEELCSCYLGFTLNLLTLIVSNSSHNNPVSSNFKGRPV